MADTAHKSVYKVGSITNIFFNILYLILQIASISSVTCFFRRNSSQKPVGRKITIFGYPEAVSSVGRKGPRNESFHAWKFTSRLFPFLFSRALGLRRWKQPTTFVLVSLGKNPRLNCYDLWCSHSLTVMLLWQSDPETRTSQGWCRLVPTGLELIRLKNSWVLIDSDCISSSLT